MTTNSVVNDRRWLWGNAWNWPADDPRQRALLLKEFQRRDRIRQQEGRNRRRDPEYRLYRRYNRFFSEWVADQKTRGLRNQWDEFVSIVGKTRSHGGNVAGL